jgi:hypothetical protein
LKYEISKVNVEHEDVFIPHLTNADKIPDKYNFDFDHKWIANGSHAKRMTVRKIKVYPMNLTTKLVLLLMIGTTVYKTLRFIIH